MSNMLANVVHGVRDIHVESLPRPVAGPGGAVLRLTATTICGSDLHIVRGEYPVKPGLIIGHEPMTGGEADFPASPHDHHQSTTP